MKRLGSDDSLGALMSMCTSTDEHSPRSTHVYSREYQTMLESLEEEGCVEESGHISEKKRRLSVDQVKALEKNFEIENKLEPERKVKLAQELGLQPRQVAVWFQNRRARWKTKQLERDYGVLKANYDALKLSCESLQHDNEALLQEVRELKMKLKDGTETQISIKEEEEMMLPEREADKLIEPQSEAYASPVAASDETANLNYDAINNATPTEVCLMVDLKDGSSDSDSSAILNEERSPIAASSPFQSHQEQHQIFPTSMSCFGVADSIEQQKGYQPQFVKMEEHNFFGVEETCNFFSDDQAPTLPWYCPDQWS